MLAIVLASSRVGSIDFWLYEVPENKQVMRRQQTIKQEQQQASCATVQAMSPAHSGHMLLLFGDERASCSGNNCCKNVARTVQVTQ